MAMDIPVKKISVIIVCIILLLVFSFGSAIIYLTFIKPSYDMQYANLFFMISFVLIFSFIAALYHMWMKKVQSFD
jgi:hypothetical protein